MPANKINSKPLDADLVNQAAEQNISGLYDWTGRLPVGRPTATDPPVIRLRKDQRSRPPTQSRGNTASAGASRAVEWDASPASMTASLKRLLRYFGELPQRDGYADDVVLVAMDFETDEQTLRVSEAGLMYFDVRKLARVPPHDFLSLVVPDYYHLSDCWDNRGDFTNPNKHAPGDPIAYKLNPISARTTDEFSRIDVPQLFWEPFGGSAKSDSKKLSSRKLVILGHGVQNQIKALNRLECDLLTNPNIIDFIDVSDLDLALRRPNHPEKQRLSLPNLVQDLKLEQRGANNAGNDAYHTLEAALAIMTQAIKMDIVSMSDEEWNANPFDDGGAGYRPRYQK